MKKALPFSTFTTSIVIATVAFLLYGYVCRLAGLYFFWESKTIGWVLFWVAAVFVLSNIIKQKKLAGKKVLFEKIGIGLCVFVIFVKGILFFVIPQTAAYTSAITFIKTNPAIKAEVGNVTGVFLVPVGGISMSSGPQGSAGQADLNFIVKGTHKYIDVNLLLYKNFDTDWQTEINR